MKPFLLIFLASVIWSQQAQALPYEPMAYPMARVTADIAVYGAVEGDLDADGTPDLITGCRTGMIASSWHDGVVKTPWQLNLPPAYVIGNAIVKFGHATDVDGDGSLDVVATARADGQDDWTLLVASPALDCILLEAVLPAGPDHRADGHWDGRYYLLGTAWIEERHLAIVALQTAYDLLPRGLRAYDLASGDLVWRYDTPGTPHTDGTLADLDGDGAPEIVMTIGSGANLDEETVRGRKDDESWLLVLDLDGSMLWERRLGPRFDAPRCAVVDVDGDNLPDIVTAGSSEFPGHDNQVVVWSGLDGRELSRWSSGVSCISLLAWEDDVTESAAIVLSFRDGKIVRLGFDGKLVVVGSHSIPEGVVLVDCGELAPEPGREILIIRNPNEPFVMSADLRILCRLPVILTNSSWSGIWNLEPYGIAAYASSSGAQRLVRVPLFRRYAGHFLGAGGILLTVALIGGLVTQRRRLERVRRTNRRELLMTFQAARHGTVDPVMKLQRTAWIFDLPPDEARIKLDETRLAIRDNVLPELESLLDKCAFVDLDRDLVRVLRRELRRCCDCLEHRDALSAKQDDRTRLARRFATSIELVAQGMASLGSTLACDGLVDPRAVLDEVASRYGSRWKQEGVTVHLPRGPQPPACRATSEDLEFCLDNLLDNATRMLAGVADATISVSWEDRGDQWAIQIADNGPGVSGDLTDSIFDQGVTTRPGSEGVGLWHSRRAMRFYGGDVTLEHRDAPGATFVVLLPQAATVRTN